MTTDIQTFNWGFTGGQENSPTIASCATLPLQVFAGTQGSFGVPPYYMMAFPTSGTPSTSFIGTNASALEWTVTYSVGSVLLLSVVDSLGTSGGVDAPLYTVVAGSSSQCIPSADTRPPFTITSNLTTGASLSTCGAWLLTIQGGTPPYKVTTVPSNSPAIANVTLAAADNVYSYINRAPPGSQMIAAVSDSTGRWADGNAEVRTSGSTDTTCPGLNSTASASTLSISSKSASSTTSISGTSSASSSSLSDTAPSSHTSGVSHRTIAIIAGTLGGAILLFIVLGLYLWKRQTRRDDARSLDMRASVYSGGPAWGSTHGYSYHTYDAVPPVTPLPAPSLHHAPSLYHPTPMQAPLMTGTMTPTSSTPPMTRTTSSGDPSAMSPLSAPELPPPYLDPRRARGQGRLKTPRGPTPEPLQ